MLTQRDTTRSNPDGRMKAKPTGNISRPKAKNVGPGGKKNDT